ELTGVLCLVDRDKPLDSQDYHLLQALVSQASVALENSRLFTKMEQANRHWIEIFDAITDFIVVHDENDHVLRVNRTLADSIGVTPVELIGVSMRTLLALTNETQRGRARSAGRVAFPTNTSIPRCSAPIWFQRRAFTARKVKGYRPSMC